MAFTVSGIQPTEVFNVKSGVGAVVIQTFLIMLSILQGLPWLALFLAINFIEYVPGVVNVIPRFVEPHVAGLFVGFALPIVPLLKVQPVAGVITQLMIFVLSQVLLPVTTAPLIDVFVNVTNVFTQAIESGVIVKSASGGVTVVIGSTPQSKKPQGFSALILT